MILKTATLLGLFFISSGWIIAKTNREATLIGIDAYSQIPSLSNCVGDVERIGKKLREHGFDTATYKDSNKSSLLKILEEIKKSEAVINLIYFAGHGVEVDGENYLVPSDCEVKTFGDFQKSALSLREVFQAISESQSRSTVLVLDCCRNNPFSSTIAPQELRGQGGLARIEASELPARLLLVYSGEPGKTVSDGKPGEGSPFNLALIKQITPGKSPLRVFTDSANEPDLRQKPWMTINTQVSEMSIMMTIPLVGKQLSRADLQVLRALAKSQGKEKRNLNRELDEKGILPGFSDSATIRWASENCDLRKRHLELVADAFFPKSYFGQSGFSGYLMKEEENLDKMIELHFEEKRVREFGFGNAVELSSIDSVHHYEAMLLNLWTMAAQSESAESRREILHQAELGSFDEDEALPKDEIAFPDAINTEPPEPKTDPDLFSTAEYQGEIDGAEAVFSINTYTDKSASGSYTYRNAPEDLVHHEIRGKFLQGKFEIEVFGDDKLQGSGTLFWKTKGTMIVWEGNVLWHGKTRKKFRLTRQK